MTILASATALAMAIALFFELRRDLMMLQQNSYRNSRYMQWLRESSRQYFDVETMYLNHILCWAD